MIFEAAEADGAPALAERLRRLPGVIEAEPQLARLRQKKFLPNDPRFAQQWYLYNTGQNGGAPGVDLNLTNVWNSWRGDGILIGIIDDGLQTAHPDLAPNLNLALGYDFFDDDPDPNPGLYSDTHGTEVAGLAAARGNNSLGLCGVAPNAALVGLRLISGPVTDPQEAAALAHRTDVISIMNSSWGAGDGTGGLQGPGPLTQAVLKSGAETGRGGLGTIYVFAAGNGRADGDDANQDGYVNSIYTIAVGAVDDQGRQTGYSESGACLHVVAPSGATGRQRVVTTDLMGDEGDDPADYYAEFSGTSASTPMVAGVIALMLQANPGLGWRDVQEILLRSARIVMPEDSEWITNRAGFHFHHGCGAGLVDAGAALGLATNWHNLGPQTNVSVLRTNLSLVIPDNSSEGLMIDLPVTNGFLRAESVTLTLSLNHPNRSELAVELIAPSGTSSRLLPAGSLAGADIPDWTFSTVRNWGENANGVWKAKFTDTRFLGIGTVVSVRLDVYGMLLPPPQLALAMTNNAVWLSLVGEVGQTYHLETSPDLAAWSGLANLTATNGQAVFVDTNQAAQQRFYRALWRPF